MRVNVSGCILFTGNAITKTLLAPFGQGLSHLEAGDRHPPPSTGWIRIRETNFSIHLIEIYPVVNIIHLLNNCPQVVRLT